MEATEQDIHQHMYTWNRQNLYNTIIAAGFIVNSIEPPIQYHIKKIENTESRKKYLDHHSTLELWVRATNPSS